MTANSRRTITERMSRGDAVVALTKLLLDENPHMYYEEARIHAEDFIRNGRNVNVHVVLPDGKRKADYFGDDPVKRRSPRLI